MGLDVVFLGDGLLERLGHFLGLELTAKLRMIKIMSFLVISNTEN